MIIEAKGGEGGENTCPTPLVEQMFSFFVPSTEQATYKTIKAY